MAALDVNQRRATRAFRETVVGRAINLSSIMLVVELIGEDQ